MNYKWNFYIGISIGIGRYKMSPYRYRPIWFFPYRNSPIYCEGRLLKASVQRLSVRASLRNALKTVITLYHLVQFRVNLGVVNFLGNLNFWSCGRLLQGQRSPTGVNELFEPVLNFKCKFRNCSFKPFWNQTQIVDGHQ